MNLSHRENLVVLADQGESSLLQTEILYITSYIKRWYTFRRIRTPSKLDRLIFEDDVPIGELSLLLFQLIAEDNLVR